MSDAVNEATRWLLRDGGALRSTIAGSIMSGLVDEIARLRITDAERKALRCAAGTCRGVGHAVRSWPENQWADIIDALLERHYP